jgi:hypothetical protein
MFAAREADYALFEKLAVTRSQGGKVTVIGTDNALVLTNPINSRLVGNHSTLFSQSPIIGNSETSHLRRGGAHFQAGGTSPLSAP